jgi:hypothetical protein
MKTIYLRDFVKTAVFGGITVGKSTKSDVIAVMGSDFRPGLSRDEFSSIMYGWYEFFYRTESEVLCGFQNDHLQFGFSNHEEMITYASDSMKIDTWFLEVNKNIKYGEVIAHLREEQIPYKIERDGYEGAIDTIKLSNEVSIDFDDRITTWVHDAESDEWDTLHTQIENPSDHILNGIRLFRY